jgi:hypothetical protein
MLIFGMEFTAIFIFVLTSILAVYLTYSAMQIIYVKDNIKSDVRKYIINQYLSMDERERNSDFYKPIDNLYKAMSKDIKTGDFIEFMENLELAKELLPFHIYKDEWEEVLDPEDRIFGEPKTNGMRFFENLEILIDAAIDVDNNRIPVEIMEFYYTALYKANLNNVCIERECYAVVSNLLMVIDFDYLEHIKTKRRCTYSEFLEAQLYNHKLKYVRKYRYADFGKGELYYLKSFFVLHYLQLYFGKYKDKIDRHTYRILIDFAENAPCENTTDYYRLFYLYQKCFEFSYPNTVFLELLVDFGRNDKSDSRIIDNHINSSIKCVKTEFSLSKDIFLCILLYRCKVSYIEDEWCRFADKALSDFYIDFYKSFQKHLVENKIYDQTFREYWSDFKFYIMVAENTNRMEEFFKEFIIYSIISNQKNVKTIVNSLEYIFEKEKLYGPMFVEFLGSDEIYESYTDKGYRAFCDIFKLDGFNRDSYNSINNAAKNLVNGGAIRDTDKGFSSFSIFIEVHFDDENTSKCLLNLLVDVSKNGNFTAFEEALIDALKDRDPKIIFDELRTELSKRKAAFDEK